ncbi:hypothetical protein H310_13215 [Aphanomyces invadans]|uniref:Nuclear segregation protein Bfr1 n=1 Tax=Aphanomyces invadans TaxID=157072 RepID=A0A024TG31_9STRA|nr:hypothetical protein H310_13215 [Aphanomyces invadans]ETV92551.1 hypothetical protein H310_13215 [Aphanomyces invadans]RHY34371.1 hypothetical protein DYB32_000984 [Aphanomyces invadans]|eukprot:XP_008878858.1 hypothetical protein H310_13215 [Aphanomyces invadans]
MADIEVVTSTPAAAPPAAPAKVAFVPKPDKAAHEAELAALEVLKKKAQDRTNAIRAELDAIQSGRSGFSEKIAEAKKLYLELREKKEHAYTSKTQLKVNLDKAMAAKSAHRESQKSVRDQVSYKSVEEVDKRIAELQHEQNTKSMSLTAEKNLLKEIANLKQSKTVLAKAAAEKDNGAKFDASIDEIRAAMKAKSEEIAAVTEAFNAQKAILDALRDESNAGGRDNYPKLIEERKALKVEIDDIFNKIKALRQKFKEDNDAYFQGLRAKREAQKAAREAEEAAVKAEFDAKMAAYEVELAKIHPYQDELDLCQALVVYLEKTYGKDLHAAAKASTTAASVTVELDGLQPLKRDDEAFFAPKKKGGKKFNNNAASSKKDVKLVLPLAQLQSFATIELAPPAFVSAVADSIAAIKAKKEWFANQTERPQAAAPVAADKPASPKKEKAAAPAKKNAKFNAADHGAFPTLSGAAPATAPEATWNRIATSAPASYDYNDVVQGDDE